MLSDKNHTLLFETCQQPEYTAFFTTVFRKLPGACYNGDMEQQAGVQQPVRKRRAPKPLWFIGFGIGIVLAAGAGTAWRLSQRAPGLLPSTITAQIRTFTPYFFVGQVPAGYAVNSANITFDQGVLFIPLTKSGAPAITISEQLVPKSVSSDTMQQNGQSVPTSIGNATINSVEGRLVGTFIVDKTLILLSSPSDSNMNELTVLLQGLRPQH
ncbi:MAG TPA: hypothetical protein VJP80_03420 [Candidatus Saccharimonadales bacterium]|nr:hypothetical protein [Candidatus Saccharimonadales bacterium]